MPKTTREWAQRKCEEAKNNIDWSGTHISQIVDIYKRDHPEAVTVLEGASLLLLEAQKLIESFRKWL